MKRFISILFTSLLFFATLNANNVLNRRVTIKGGKTTIKEALQQIVRQSAVQFVYISGAFDEGKTINHCSQQTTIKNELNALFPNDEVCIKTAGNKIILTKNTKATKRNTAKTYRPTNVIKEHETELVRYDSIIYKHDTIRTIKRDTVTIYKHEDKNSNKRLGRSKKNFNNGYDYKANGYFSFGIQTEGEYPIEKLSNNSSDNNYFQMLKNSENIKIGGSVCFIARYNLPHFSFDFGLGWSLKQWDTDYDFTNITTDYNTIAGYTEEDKMILNPNKEEGKPWEHDSILTILRTPIYRQDTAITNYHTTNTAHYLSIPIGINYHHNIYDSRFEWETGLAFQLRLLLSASGKSMEADNKQIIELKEHLLQDFHVKGGIHIGLNYNIDHHNTIGVSAGLSSNLTPIFNNNSAATRNELTPEFGINYYFSPF